MYSPILGLYVSGAGTAFRPGVEDAIFSAMMASMVISEREEGNIQSMNLTKI